MKALFGGLKARVILTYLVIFLVSAAIVVVRAGTLFARNTLDSAEHDLEAQAYVMATAIERPWAGFQGLGEGTITVPQLLDLQGRFAGNGGGQLNVLDSAGRVLATSLQNVPPAQRKAPEVAGALAGQLQHDVRLDAIAGKKLIFAAAPVQHEGQVFGVVQLAVPLDDVTAQIDRFWLGLGLTALLAALAASLAGWWLSEQLVRPVRRLSAAATRLAAGNLDERVSSGGVAEIAQLGDAFNHMAEQIEEMIGHERAFVANASHELRTPLTNIKLRAEALGNGALDDPTAARRFVRDIESEANRLGRMAGDLLNLSRYDAAAPAAREAVDPGKLLADVAGQLTLRAEKSGILLVQEVAPGLPVISADPVGLETVLINLVDNALQYTPTGGSVTVRARLSPAYADGSGPRQELVLQVADTGIGIAAEDLPHIFERFYRADKARSRTNGRRAAGSLAAGSGAGLGLALVRGIVEQHGGAVEAQSTVGQGTTITVRLPVSPVSESAQAVGAQPAV